jgi:hypothetical protein
MKWDLRNLAIVTQRTHTLLCLTSHQQWSKEQKAIGNVAKDNLYEKMFGMPSLTIYWEGILPSPHTTGLSLVSCP